jgi:hypothetical protein
MKSIFNHTVEKGNMGILYVFTSWRDHRMSRTTRSSLEFETKLRHEAEIIKKTLRGFLKQRAHAYKYAKYSDPKKNQALNDLNYHLALVGNEHPTKLFKTISIHADKWRLLTPYVKNSLNEQIEEIMQHCKFRNGDYEPKNQLPLFQTQKSA